MEESLAVSQFTSSAAIVMIIQWLKASTHFPWLTENSDRFNRAASVLCAIVSAVVIHHVYDASAGTLTLVLNINTIPHLAWGAIQQLAGQEIIYKAALKK